MRPTVLAAFALACSCFAAPAAEKPGDGWTDLMTPAAWKKVDPAWVVADDVTLDGEKGNRLKAVEKDGGAAWMNGQKGRLPDLYTKQDFGDCAVHVEFLIAKGSNAGIKFHGVYELQILDSFGSKKELTGDGMGGIYPRAEIAGGKYRHTDAGTAPKVNAAKPPGEWQTLDVTWQSPRFDAAGTKTANAVVVKAVLNGQVIHENQDVRTPTGTNWTKKETPTGPFMLQCDHGPVAWRAVRIKAVK